MALTNFDKLNFMIEKIQDFEDYLEPDRVFEREQMPQKRAEAQKKINGYFDENTKEKVKGLLEIEKEKYENPSSKKEFLDAAGRIIMYNIQKKDEYYLKFEKSYRNLNNEQQDLVRQDYIDIIKAQNKNKGKWKPIKRIHNYSIWRY